MTLGWIRNTANLAASTLSKCHAMQTWQGATYTQAQALGRIYHHALPPPANKREHTLAELAALRPFVLLYTEQGDGLDVTRDTAGTDWGPRATGHLVACFECAIPTIDINDPAKVASDFEQFLGLMIGTGATNQPGLYELFGQPGELAGTRVVYRGYARTDPADVAEIGDCLRGWLDLYWSVG
jgi:hypothetical protein